MTALAEAIVEEQILEDVQTLEDRIAEHAARTGIEEERVHAIRYDVSAMKDLGLLIDIDLHGFTMFNMRASHTELGIPKTDTRARRITSGTKYLISIDYIKRLNALDSRFRKSLVRKTFDVEGFRPFRWMPYTAYEAWREEWDALQEELETLKDDIIDNYPQIRAALREDFSEIGRESWDAHMARYDGAGVLELPDGTFVHSREEMADYVVNRILDRLPTTKAVRAGIHADYKNGLILAQSEIEAEQMAAERLRAQQAEERARRAYADERAAADRRVAQEEERVQMRLMHEDEQAERDRIRQDVEEREIKLRAMHDAEMEHAREQLRRMGSPLQEFFDQMRAQIYDAVTSISAGIAKHGYLHGSTAKQADGLLETYQLLGAGMDHELEAALEDLQSRLDRRVTNEKGKETRDTDAIAAELDRIEEMLRNSKERVERAQGSSRAGALML
jgi:hypothetical protein